MTFPLGSLRADGGAPTAPKPGAGPAGTPRWRAQLRLFVGGVVWLLVVIALATHDAADPGFTTSGSGGPIANKAGTLGAWFSDAAFFLVGYSIWWIVLVTARTWLGALARVLRSQHAPLIAPPEPQDAPRWLFWLGLALRRAASSALEWTRL
jgi:S-DNA-T family DNA segregation ATPase FtsK/SpoIIIE